jgi:hypothetical protein
MTSQDLTLKKMLLQATLVANLNTLKVYMPNIYAIFKDYLPENSGVVLDKQGNINLVNNGDYVYESEAKDFCCQQVDLFLKKPSVFHFQLAHQEDADIDFEHARFLKDISVKRLNEAGNNTESVKEAQLDMLCMVGSGLGYQIEALFEQKKIVNFFLYEPSQDIFYAMLHCIELKPIIESCQSLGGRMSIRIGGSPSGVINTFSEMLHQQGHFNVSRIFFYRHYVSETSDEIFQLFKDVVNRYTSGWGFMEDEIISISHTLSNIQSGFKICKKIEFFENNIFAKPVFIAGNGPSLDDAMSFLKANKNKIIIVSVGTSLKALLKNDIKPDIHIEMERTLHTLPYLDAIEEQQKNSDTKLSDIQIIALNTVAPSVLAKFKNPLLVIKKYDGGGQVMQKSDKLARHIAPEYSNPTVSNTALVTLLSLGFKNIYLIGTDFGYLSESQHHSKDSIYYDEDYFDKELVEKDIDQNKKVKGNFVDFVYTTNIFDSSRANIELALQQQTVEFKNIDVKVYNCSNGAAISFTEPKHISELAEFEDFLNKNDSINDLLVNAFENKQFSDKKLNKAITNHFHEVKVILDQLFTFVDKEFHSREELSAAMHLQNALLMKLKSREEYQVTYWIIQGSFRYFQAQLMTNTYYYSDLKARNKFINDCLSAFKEHMYQRYSELLNSYNKPSKV